MFRNGFLSKYHYCRLMSWGHKLLSYYVMDMAESGISRFEITAKGVVAYPKYCKFGLLCDMKDYMSPGFRFYNLSNSDQKDIDIIVKILQGQSGNIVDIGANHGWFSLYLASLFPNRSIFSFEPISHSFDYLQRNVELNGFCNIYCYNIGLGKHNTKQSFYYDRSHLTRSGLKDNTRCWFPKKEVCCIVSLDYFSTINDLGEIALIKLDIEGAELLAIEGGRNIISSYGPIIYIEIFEKWINKYHYSANDISSYLLNMGYIGTVFRRGVFEKINKDKPLDGNYFFFTFRHIKMFAKYFDKNICDS